MVVEPWPDEVIRDPALDRVGYARRACGFDLDGNGVPGEPQDCRVCDGRTKDVDGNGVEDRLLYVDCDSAAAGDGSPARPFAAIAEAMDVLEAPSVDSIQGVCFRGRCRESVTPSQSGALGGRVVDGFERARFPFVLAGWDADGDGAYPPYDEDDLALLDARGLSTAVVNDQAASRLELAHFAVEGFGGDAPSLLDVAPRDAVLSHLRVHDLEVRAESGDCPAPSGPVVRLFGASSASSFVALSNVEIAADRDVVAGHRADVGVLGPYRLENLSVRSRSGRAVAIDGTVDGAAVLRSWFEATSPDETCAASSLRVGILAGPCSRGWRVQDNDLVDWARAMVVRPDEGADGCRSRDMDGVTIFANRIVSARDREGAEEGALLVDRGDVATVVRVDVVDNIATTSTWESCLAFNVGSETERQPGLVRVLGNECRGPIRGQAALTIGAPVHRGDEPAFPQHRYEVRDNRFVGVETVNVNTGYVVDDLRLSGNVYDPDAGFSWAYDDPAFVTHTTLDEWARVSGESETSVACVPEVLGCLPLEPQ